jgi:hypothetical protein
MTNHTDYYLWLIAQIGVPEKNRNTYNDLFMRLHETEFVWIVPHDDNRLQDGVELRNEFLNGRHIPDLEERPISILEVLIALSRRVSWTTDRSPEFWAWQLLDNLRLTKSSDPLVGRKAERVEEILETLIWRTYEQDGNGGFFPLQFPQDDQTKREIWDQMNAYVNEMNLY